jgi:hypothetical protein
VEESSFSNLLDEDEEEMEWKDELEDLPMAEERFVAMEQDGGEQDEEP